MDNESKNQELPDNSVASQLDIEGRMRDYFPILFELLGENKLNWKKITRVFREKLDVWHLKYEKEGKPIRVEASLYNIITASIQGDERALGFLNFIQRLFEELIERLDKKERKLIMNAIYGLLTNINSMYLNFLGELCVLNNAKKNTGLQLTAVEVPALPNKPKGKKIDFDFINPLNGNHHLIEIVNVHISEEQELNDARINQIVHQKIQGKLNITGIRETDTFQLVPVFWGQVESLRKINNFYKANDIRFQNTSYPAAFATLIYKGDQRVHVFGLLDQVIQYGLSDN